LKKGTSLSVTQLGRAGISVRSWEGQVHHYTAWKGRFITTQLGRAGISVRSWEGQVHNYTAWKGRFITTQLGRAGS